MHLKRLDIQGFKSFAERVELQFGPGVTVVVGPNGSGKSNVADAIRWVLGEQSSKTLRGTRMEDVIFAGSDRRRPVGMAEVSLTLDNSSGKLPLEFNEVTVTRRLYRSGEAEYLINKVPCRLRDVHELFMDTGIGRESFSIIGQGRVDEVLSARPEERRVLIEDAAGITKYRQRKKEAVRKLEDTEQNLIRLQDIIAELDNQLGPLEEQAEKARIYLDSKKELDQAEVSVWVADLEEMQRKFSQARSETEKLQEEAWEAETAFLKAGSMLEEIRLEITRLDEQIANLSENMYNFAGQMERTEAEIRVDETRCQALTDNQARLAREMTELMARARQLHQQHQQAEGRFNDLTERVQELEELLAIREAEVRAALAARETRSSGIEQAKAEFIDLLNRIAGKKHHLDQLAFRAAESAKQQRAYQEQLRDNDRQKANLAAEGVTRRQALAGLEERLGDLQGQRQAAQAQRQELQAALERARVDLSKRREETGSVQSRLSVLKDLARAYEGYGAGVRQVMQGKQKGHPACQGVRGVVAEVIEFEPALRLAMEVALGGTQQNLITGTDEEAKAAIGYLKAGGKGRATFLPLNALQFYRLNANEEALAQESGILGWAADLVTCRPEFIPAVQYLVGRVLVAENLDAALRVSRKSGFRLRIVTLEGDRINPGGAMTGGSFERTGSGVLGRAQEITDLQGRLAGQEAEIQQAIVAISRLEQQLEQAGQTLNEQEKMLRETELERAAAVRDVETWQARMVELSERRRVLELELAGLEQDINAASDPAEINRELAALEARRLELDNLVRDGEQQVKAGQKRLDELGEIVTQVKVSLAGARQEALNSRDNLQRLAREEGDLTAGAQDKDSQINSLLAEEDKLSTAMAAARIRLQGLETKRHQVEQELLGQKEKRAAIQEKLNAIEDDARRGQRKVQETQARLNSAQVKLTRIEIEHENALNRLQENYGLTLEAAQERRGPVLNRREALARIKELKQIIADLGQVNTGALEEFERVRERHDFLNTQHEDLIQARVVLNRVIDEMDRMMTKKFRETLVQVNQEFNLVFQELFGGGRAELGLSPDGGLLEAGVEISAQPPGKKLQHLSLLSGGEKALTAISLLFALIRVRPSPFCVLDEIETALDEVNITRFAEYLRDLAQKTQFIVISHRKGTIEVADVLYGVTTAESGVSKIVSVKLQEAVETARAG